MTSNITLYKENGQYDSHTYVYLCINTKSKNRDLYTGVKEG